MKRRQKAGFIILVFTIFIYALSWKFPKAVDWYRLYLFPIGTNTLARIMSVFPFSVGEILILAGIVLLPGSILIAILRLIAKKRFQKLFRRYTELLCWILLWVAVTETFHCFVLYHAATVEETYYKDTELEDHTLTELYEMIVENANRLSEEMKRDENGGVIYEGDLYQECKTAMQALGEEYPYLGGYYPNPKPIANSDFMSQQYLSGIYFPFTLEANYNQTMYVMNRPAAICHELSHLKGVILEDEANYFGFLACISSKDPHVEYSGYLSVLSYVSREIRKNMPKEVRQNLTQPNAYVQQDAVFLTEEAWEKVEKKAVVSTETANKATNAFLESNLKTNGVKAGMESYRQVVRLLLAWYQENQ